MSAVTPAILALFTRARRLHQRRSVERLAARLAITPGQLRRAESGLPVGAKARARLIAFNRLEAKE